MTRKLVLLPIVLTAQWVLAQAVGFNPTSVNFGSEYVNVISLQQMITVTNTGSSTLTISSVTLTGRNASQFELLEPGTGTGVDCRTVGSVSPNGTCTIAVAFTPNTFDTPTSSAVVTVADSVSGGPQAVQFVPLVGMAVPTITPGLSQQWIAFNRASAPNSADQCFIPNNIDVSGGELGIYTELQNWTCNSFDFPNLTQYNYTSGEVATRPFNFLYGTVEFRAKFGGGANTGAWPVVWLLDSSCQPSDPTGTDDNCNGQEIDIAEILDSAFTQVNQQIHVDGFTHNDGCTASTTDTSQNWHVYDLIWSSGSLVWEIDGTPTCTITQSYVPNAPMYLKIDMYVGGCCGGTVDNSSFPWTTLVDYVKVTQNSVVIFDDEFDGGIVK